ncbi:MAG: copper resistance protein B [Gammaproteobacteria bacterium]|nr:copper resistance protein B [Gammaproteobacteria bacterium]
MPVHAHENPVLTKWMLDRFEQRTSNGADQTYWEAQVWTGVDEHKLWLKTEGSRRHGITEDADLEAYYSRAVAAFWDTQIGMRHDFSVANTPSRNWLGVGFQGLAPYLFEVGATAYLGGNGRTAIRLKSQYDLLLTQNWVFMPEIELNAYGKADPERNLGSGVSDASLTLRVRYDIRRELSPYLGLMWTQKYADTADFARAAGEPVAETHYVAGIRAWW